MSAVLESPVATCGCAGCRVGLEPFTREHFIVWAGELVLDTGEPWVVEEFFAGFAEDVFSGFRECWLIVPEGNAKTTGLAGLALYHCEHMVSAWVPWAASSRDQAEIGYRQAEGFVLRTRRLRGVFKCQEGYRRIKGLATGGRIQIFAADASTGDGVIPTMPILDELHRHKNLKLYRTWVGKLDKRNGQLLTISTAGEPGSEFEDVRERIRQSGVQERAGSFLRVASGERLVLHEWAVPEKGDVDDLELVKSANPFSKITVESLREKRESPTFDLPHWRRLTCNLPTRSDSAALTERQWADALAPEGRRVIPAGEPVWVGLDLGWKHDTTAIVPLWAPEPEFRLFGPAVILTPPPDGSQLPVDDVKRALVELHERTPIHTVVMDMSHGEDTAQWIEDELGAEVVDRGQGNVMASLDYARFMEGLRERTMFHSGDAGLRAHALNAVARILPGGDTRFDRPREARNVSPELQRRRVIDALIAAAMVHSTAVALFREPVADLMPAVFV